MKINNKSMHIQLIKKYKQQTKHHNAFMLWKPSLSEMLEGTVLYIVIIPYPDLSTFFVHNTTNT